MSTRLPQDRQDSLIRAGRAWCFGDHISTDLMMPGAQVLAGNDEGRPAHLWCFEAVRPGWAMLVEPGDLIVAGRNFGCGSGRNGAQLLRKLGIGAVVADSVSRAFFRNAVNAALPVMDCPGVSDLVSEGDRLVLDVVAGTVGNETTERTLRSEPMPLDSPPMQILLAGGFDPFVALVRAGFDPRAGRTVPDTKDEYHD
ncbi:3-isopropylmalate dehydratase [Streptacidiphilus sp. P02-A3a]|uniref:LeuD/DmdB family oxidoreductase small subunit n=1 Tax=Streptacidiphilus sp. P02-A3a TaxID=2704468 RepID=UPI0015F91C3C|nr:3-isopropylmalate dehydratase [Streptacidiphilus sp. P02-A3a]QMU67193.1 3-isopropylmalate dehydratase [Streptacidiphilus sp. P02-A3a]